ncbi:hypothetical protein ACN47E_007998 [Coniothyrium glycines]
MLTVKKLLFFAYAITWTTFAAAASAPIPAPGTVTVTSLEVDTKGGACKPGEVGVAISPDNSAITVIFDNFQAADGPNAPDTTKRAACRVNIGINAPGWTFDITSTDFRGYVYLESGVVANLESQWKWNTGGGKASMSKTVNGPFSDDFLLHQNGEIFDRTANVCQKKNTTLTIGLIVTVKSGGSKATGIVR